MLPQQGHVKYKCIAKFFTAFSENLIDLSGRVINIAINIGDANNFYSFIPFYTLYLLGNIIIQFQKILGAALKKAKKNQDDFQKPCFLQK